MHDCVVRDYQNHCAEQPAREREVVADDRVLDDVRQQQQNDEVERVQLRDRALPGEVQEDDEREIDGNRANRLLGGRDPEVNQVVDHTTGVRYAYPRTFKYETTTLATATATRPAMPVGPSRP